MKPEDRKRLKQHIEMIVEHKTPIEELEDMNRKLRLELHTLRFKEAQEQRFIWWIWNVYSRNVNDLIYDIMGATTYDTEGEAKDGKYSLPKHCFDLIKKIDEYTEHIYDGTYLDVEISKDAKTVISEGSEPSNSDVSVTQDVLTDIKTGQSIENTNPDYYKQEIARLTALVERLKEDAERLAKYCQHIPMPDTTCGMSSSGAWNCNCGATEAFYIHRTLMKELE